jgi:hypothetical protein
MSIGYLIGNWSRFYVVDKNYRALAKIDLTGSVDEKAAKIRNISEGVPPPEIITLVQQSLKSVDTVAVEHELLAEALAKEVSHIVCVQDDIFRRLRLMFFRKGVHPQQEVAVTTAVQTKQKMDAHPDRVIHRLIDTLTAFDDTYTFYEDFVATWHKNIYSAHSQEAHIIQNIDGILQTLSELQKETRKALESVLKKWAPNVQKIAGTEIAAKLIAEAGSLKQLSCMAAGSIQVLGAKEALFRAQYTNAPPPKYGIIFSHPLIQEVPPGKRGKMARLLSCQIAIACRADYFTHGDIADQLNLKLEKRFQELKGELK